MVAQPYVQLQGYSPLPLAGVTYDLSNAVTFVTDQPGNLIGQTLDTNTLSFTTNYFQCFDIPLTNGPNWIAVHCSDAAGNVTTTNLSIALDYSAATNPVIRLTWPTNSMAICASSFTLRAWTEDASATVGARMVDTGGNTNLLSGVMERSGVLWVDNVPLAEGSNWLTLWVTNAAGLSSETNIILVKSDMVLTLTNIDGLSLPQVDAHLWLPQVDVSGLVDDPTATIYVNGVEGTNYGDGTWGASNVPVTPGGVASFDMDAVPAGGGDPWNDLGVDKPSSQVLDSATWTREENYSSGAAVTISGGYSFAHGGSLTQTTYYNGSVTDVREWDLAGGWQFPLISAYYDNGVQEYDPDQYYMPKPLVPLEWFEEGSLRTPGNGSTVAVSSTMKGVKYLGGRGFLGQRVLVAVQAAATKDQTAPVYQQPWPWSEISPQTGPAIDSTWIAIPGLGKNLGADGWAYGTGVLGQSLEVSPTVNGEPLYEDSDFEGANVRTYALSIQANNTDLGFDDLLGVFPTPEFCVGQQVNFQTAWNGSTYWLYSPPNVDYVNTTYNWTFSGKFVNHSWQLQEWIPTDPYGQSGYYQGYGSLNYDIDEDLLNVAGPYAWWYSGGLKHAYLHETLHFSNGQSVTLFATGQFQMLKPSIEQLYTNISAEFTTFGDGTEDMYCSVIFKAWVRPPKSLSGTASFAQLIDTDYYYNLVFNYWFTTFGGYYLDNFYPYSSKHVSWNDNPLNAVVESDMPGFERHSYGGGMSVDDSFKTYLQFCPDGGIPVTLVSLTWGWTGAAYETGGTWTGGVIPTGPTINWADDSFPSWTNVYYNGTAWLY